MDFTIIKYTELLENLQKAGYTFQTFAQFIESPGKKTIVLRHDVDKLPVNSFRFAVIQEKMGISGSYYFRVIPQSFDANIIKKIFELGHEVGYHYENMDSCKGDTNLAYEEFCKNLQIMRKLVPVKTICMHGSPLSEFDNRAIWEQFDYKKLGIIAEPYFDIDFNKVYYITDTGRRFDGDKVSVRDKPLQKVDIKWPLFHDTNSIIHALQTNSFPDLVMMTFHPQRWTDNLLFWSKEWIWQNVKNTVKRVVVLKSNKKK